MPQTTYLVVGASRGIGRSIVEQLSQDPSNYVLATTRQPIDFDKSNVHNLILEQTDSKSVEAASAEVQKIDVLIVNAAIGNQEFLLSTSIERLQQYLETNVVGVHRVVNAFIPALKAGDTKKIVIISSFSGSLAGQKNSKQGFQGPYSVTKSANNMQVMQYHNELHGEGFAVLAIHPGWVGTDMGSIVKVEGSQPISPEKSAKGIVKCIQSLKLEDSGSFWVYDGSTMPW